VRTEEGKGEKGKKKEDLCSGEPPAVAATMTAIVVCRAALRAEVRRNES
jgi:hypothetical protein